VEAGQAAGVVGQPFWQELEGHGLPQLQVVGAGPGCECTLPQPRAWRRVS
jgi:hypothetical protein